MAERFQFGDCTIDVGRRTLLRDGHAVGLPPLAFDCLVYLIRQRERAVGRDELVAAVWGKLSVSDAALGKTILTVRRALGDDGEQQRLLRTVPRFGYRWSAPTQQLDVTSEPAAADVAEPEPLPLAPPAAPPRVRRYALLIGVAALAALAAFGIWRLFPPKPIAPPPPTATATTEWPSGVLAVLPAEVMAAADDAWLRLGVMDILATRLGASGLKVLPSDNVVRLLPAGVDRAQALTALRGVTERGRLIAPLVRRSGNEWIVRAELIDADGDTQVVQAQADSAIAAAGAAAERLLELLGQRAAAAPATIARLSETELLQRVDAARLARQPQQALALIEAAAPMLQESAPVRLRRAQIAVDLGDSDGARTQLEALVAGVSAEADPVLLARAQRSLCVALSRLDRADAARQACDRAIELLEGRELPDDLARAYNNRGVVGLTRQRYDEATQDFARAKIAANLAVDPLLLAQIEGNEANTQALQGRYAEVADTQQRLGERFRKLGLIDEYVIALINQSNAEVTLLRPAPALETSGRALAQLPQVEHAGTRLLAYLERANALELNGRFDEARGLLDRVGREATDADLAQERGIGLGIGARLDLAQAQPETALALARQALAALPAQSANVHRADAWHSVVAALIALRRGAEASGEVHAFAAWAASSNDPYVTLLARLTGAEQSAAAGDASAARAAYADALERARRWSTPDLLCEVGAAYGRFLIGQGDLDQASTVVGQLARYAEVDFDAAVAQAELYRALGRETAAAGALAQARRLAGERPLPASLTAAAAVIAKSPSGKDSETDAQ